MDEILAIDDPVDKRNLKIKKSAQLIAFNIDKLSTGK